MPDPMTASRIEELYRDPVQCATLAGLVHVHGDEPGFTRRRRGRGFSYATHDARPVPDEVRERITALAIPPAWRDVWICPTPDGHVLATGEDERGRKQYVYHPRWRELRDLLNSYRLLTVVEVLPVVRAHTAAQLRRRTLDREQVVAAMLRVIDVAGIRIGNEVYAEENESYGLSTLTAEHARARTATVELSFPAKSGKHARTVVRDRAVTRVVRALLAAGHERVFSVDGVAVGSAEVNATLAEVSGEHVTAKDFRHWRGTASAFAVLRAGADELTGAGQRERDAAVLAAVDTAAAALDNTRTVARAHYVHPHLLRAAARGTLAADLARATPRRHELLGEDEAWLAGLLQVLFDDEFAAGSVDQPLVLAAAARPATR